jgi:6,7-dimethyl-8-ribityllumazine synthase
MSGTGQPIQAPVDAAGLKVAIVAGRWHPEISDALVDGALRACRESGVLDPDLIRVPGAFELPIVARAAAAGHDAVVALGLVLRGGTPHFEYVCDAATSGLTRVALDTGTPVGFGLLTCDTEEQAFDRSGLPGSKEDKGREATLAALETALLLRGPEVSGTRHQSVGFGVR